MCRRKNGWLTETMLHLLFSSHDNRRSTFSDRTSREPAPAIVLLSYKQVEHGFPENQQRSCCSRCSTLMTTGGGGGGWFPTDHSPVVGLQCSLQNKYRPCTSYCSTLMTTGGVRFPIQLTETMLQLSFTS